MALHFFVLQNNTGMLTANANGGCHPFQKQTVKNFYRQFSNNAGLGISALLNNIIC